MFQVIAVAISCDLWTPLLVSNEYFTRADRGRRRSNRFEFVGPIPDVIPRLVTERGVSRIHLKLGGMVKKSPRSPLISRADSPDRLGASEKFQRRHPALRADRLEIQSW